MPSPGFWIGLGNGVKGAGQVFAGAEQEHYRRQQQQIQNQLAQDRFAEEQARNEQQQVQFGINQRPPGTPLTPEEVAALARTGNQWASKHEDPTIGSTPLQGQGAGLSNMPMSPEDVLGIAQPQGQANLPPMAGHDARDVSVPTEDAKYRASVIGQQMRQQQFYDDLARKNAQGNRGLDIRQGAVDQQGQHWNEMEAIARIMAAAAQGRGGETTTHNSVMEQLMMEKMIMDEANGMREFQPIVPGMSLSPEQEAKKAAWIQQRKATLQGMQRPAQAPAQGPLQAPAPMNPMSSHGGPQRPVGPTPTPDAAKRIKVMDLLRQNHQPATDANVDAFLAKYPDFR